MSLCLNRGTKPAGLEIKTWWPKTVHLGDYEISIEDFLIAAKYVLTNTDLEPDDPRLQFVKCVQSMRETDGYNPSGKRLASSVPPVLPENRE